MRRLLLTLALVAPACLASGVFRWTDTDGRVHYGDRPGGAHAAAVRTGPAPAVEPAAAERRALQQRLLDAYARDRRDRREQQAVALKRAERRAESCLLARERLRALEDAGAVYELDAGGERRYLDDSARAAATGRARDTVAYWCD